MATANSIVFESLEEQLYMEFLQKSGYEFSQMGNYLRMGNVPNDAGWILYVSVIYIDVLPLLKDIVPIIKKQQATAFFPRDPKMTMLISAGHLSSQHIGKAIGIIPAKGRELDLLLALRQVTVKYRGQRLYDCYNLLENIYGAYYKLTNQDRFQDRDEWLGSMTLLDLLLSQVQAGDPLYKKVWPFTKVVRMELLRLKENTITRGYAEKEVLKNDSKGKVSIVRTRLKVPAKNYILKEGHKYVSTDAQGRDITDRLRWQFEVHRELHGIIPLAKPIELVEGDDSVAFVMELIKGISLTAVIDRVYAYCGGWIELKHEGRKQLLNLLMQVVDIAETMHNHGFIHRDISTENFLIDDKGKMVCIDLELVYDLNTNFPEPPFVYGTYGFMSPEQKKVDVPTPAQDVYSIGALMIKVFTGLSPVLIHTDATEELFEALKFLTGDARIASAICACMAHDPNDRMRLPELKGFLASYLALSGKEEGDDVKPFATDELQALVRQGLAGMVNPQMINGHGLWVSKVKLGSVVENEQVNLQPLLGLHTGMGGTLHLLLTAHRVGWDLEKYSEHIDRNFNYLINAVLSVKGMSNSNLYHGLPGLAVLLQQAVDAGWLPLFPELSAVIQNILNVETADLSLASGLAGQGLALLQIHSLLKEDDRRETLAEIAHQIISAQQANGSWIMRWNDVHSKEKVLGLDYGAAGVIYFLLKYFEAFKDQAAYVAVQSGLRFMQAAATKTGDRYSWPVYLGAPQNDLWLSHGIAGMCIPFIKAYEITSEISYKKIAEEVLGNHLFSMATQNWGIASGMAGLGHVYLSAYRAFGSVEWIERASWITNFFSRIYNRPDENSLTWTVDGSTVPTTDLMTGSAGVVHYLLRYFLPDNISYPIIN